MRRLKYIIPGLIIALLVSGLFMVYSYSQTRAAVESENLARFVALMQYIRSQPTPSDVNADRLPELAVLDEIFIDLYAEGFIVPFTGVTAGEVRQRLESVSEEDRYAAAMVETYRLSSNDLLLTIIHQLLAEYYVNYFTTADLAGAKEFLGKSEIQGLAMAFDAADYTIPAPSVSQPGDMAMPVPAVNAPQPTGPTGVINIAITDVAPGVGLGSAQLSDAVHYWGVGEVTMKFVPPGVVAPMLASGWTVDFDGGAHPTGATLTIRDDVIFHGQGLGDRSNLGGSWGPMTAHDIAFTINDANTYTNSSSIHWQGGHFASTLGDNLAVAEDDTTLKITFSEIAPDPRWSSYLFNDAAQAFSVQSLNRYETVGEAEMRDTNFIGTGPLHIVEWTQDDRAVLEAVPYDHWNANSKVDRIVFREVRGQDTQMAMMETGHLDAAPIHLESLPPMLEGGFATADTGLANHASVVFSGNLWESEHVLFGTPLDTSAVHLRDVPWVSDPNPDSRGRCPGGCSNFEEGVLVRNALARAIDRNQINDDVLSGIGHPVYLNQFSPNNPNWQSRWEYPYDPAEAGRLLDEAGYSNGFDIPLYVPNPGGYQGIADAIAGYWDEIGVRTSVQKFAYVVYRPSVVARATTLPWVASCDDGKSTWPWNWPKSADHTLLTRGGFGCGVEIKQVADTWAAVTGETDPARQIALNNELAQYLFEHAVSVGVVAVPSPITYNPKKIASWPMDPALFATWNNPEDLVPVGR